MALSRRLYVFFIAIGVGMSLGSAAAAAPSAEAAAYLHRAADLIEAHSLHRDDIDWDEFRAALIDDAAHAKTTRDTHPALRAALERLGDRHSALIVPAPTRPGPTSHDAVAPVAAMPTGHLTDGGVGYLRVPGHVGGDPDADAAYADKLQVLIHHLDADAHCGWVIDLRDNPGGNMWPMLAGLQPLLGSGQVGSFRYPAAEALPWWVDDGMAGSGSTVQAASRYAVSLDGAAPVALLLGTATASSGEAVAVAFRGRDDTRSFGETTYGVTTGNRGFVLEDGAILFVTASRFADRTGRVYGGSLEPDVPVSSSAALDAAHRWLSSRSGCGADDEA